MGRQETQMAGRFDVGLVAKDSWDAGSGPRWCRLKHGPCQGQAGGRPIVSLPCRRSPSVWSTRHPIALAAGGSLQRWALSVVPVAPATPCGPRPCFSPHADSPILHPSTLYFSGLGGEDRVQIDSLLSLWAYMAYLPVEFECFPWLTDCHSLELTQHFLSFP